MKRWITFFFFLIIFMSPFYAYFHWSFGTSWFSNLIQILMLLFILFPVMRQNKFLAHISFFSMGALSFIFIFSLTKDAMGIFNLYVEHEWILTSSIIASLSATRNAFKSPLVKKWNLEIKDLLPEENDLKIVQISDLHIGPAIGKNYVDHIVSKVNELKPDIIALTGDIGDGPVDKHRETIESLRNLKSRLGVFFVPGNHEYYWNANEWMNAMNNLKFIVLVNRGKIIEYKNKKILICGVSDPAGGINPDPMTSLDVGHHTDLKILLSHRPALAEEASKLGYHLQLSGHTHGGQFFPWTLFVKIFHKHVAGMYQIRDMWLNVNPGTGSWGPMMRLGTRTEISLIEINCSKKIDHQT